MRAYAQKFAVRKGLRPQLFIDASGSSGVRDRTHERGFIDFEPIAATASASNATVLAPDIPWTCSAHWRLFLHFLMSAHVVEYMVRSDLTPTRILGTPRLLPQFFALRRRMQGDRQLHDVLRALGNSMRETTLFPPCAKERRRFPRRWLHALQCEVIPAFSLIQPT